MIQIRKSTDRGHFHHGWLETFHTFSFADYRAPEHGRFRALRVMNEDRVAPGQGFGTHPHRDMEIVTYVLSGALQHKDSMGHGKVLRAGEFQRMSAGSGITHSEFNPSKSEPAHLYQIWIFPEQKGIDPSYEQKRFDEANRRNRLQLVASRDGAEGSLRIHQDTRIYLANISAGHEVTHAIPESRHAWVQILRGSAEVGEMVLSAGDGAALSGNKSLVFRGLGNAEIMLFDLA